MLCPNWLVYIISTMWQISKFRSSSSLPLQMYATVRLQSYICSVHEVIGTQYTTRYDLSMRTHVFRLLLQPCVNQYMVCVCHHDTRHDSSDRGSC